MEDNVPEHTESDADGVLTAVSAVKNSSYQNNFIPRFLPVSPPINWGLNHPDYGKDANKRARWSADELQYLSNLIVSLTSQDTSPRLEVFIDIIVDLFTIKNLIIAI
jgi:hypothetical protein